MFTTLTTARLRRRVLAAAVALAASGAAFAADAPAPEHVIKDPHYGDTLFYFFQERYFTSITKLMVSQQFNRVSQHADEAEILRGGMLLSYGMHVEAGQIFAQLIERGAEPKVRDRAWFYLAKIRYQRGALPGAEEAINQIGNALPPELEEERVLLQANLLMAREDNAGAANVLAAVKANKSAGRYARFNLGIALIRSGDEAGGSAILEALGKEPAENEEYRALRDRANVALGYAALQAKKPELARQHLERVRLTSLHANKALLGFGWAAAEMKEPKLALVPWLELSQRDVSDAAVLESRIAVPYAYAELKAYGQSLARYNEAIDAFDRERKDLDESIAAIRAGKLLNGLLEKNPAEEMGWFWTVEQLPEMPHASHLAPVLAQHEFQEAFKNFRDLQFLSRNLNEWAENLGVFSDMLANRREAYAKRLPEVRAKLNETGLASIKQRVEAVAAELKRAEAEPDGPALADEKQRDLLARLERVRAGLADAAKDDPDAAAMRERYRLVAGALAWQLDQQYPARLWETQKSFRSVDDELQAALARDAALAQAQRDEPARFDAFAARIKALDPQLQALIPRVAALSKEQQQAVQELAVAELERQKERLTEYTTQARFAVAQLYDRANQPANQDADRASKQ